MDAQTFMEMARPANQDASVGILYIFSSLVGAGIFVVAGMLVARFYITLGRIGHYIQLKSKVLEEDRER